MLVKWNLSMMINYLGAKDGNKLIFHNYDDIDN